MFERGVFRSGGEFVKSVSSSLFLCSGLDLRFMSSILIIISALEIWLAAGQFMANRFVARCYDIASSAAVETPWLVFGRKMSYTCDSREIEVAALVKTSVGGKQVLERSFRMTK